MKQTFDWQWVERQAAETISGWNDCVSGPSHRGTVYTAAEQQRSEDAYDEALCAIEEESRNVSYTAADPGETRERLIRLFGRFSSSALGLNTAATQLLTDDFLPVGADLARWARQFDPDLSMDDIIQACRNAWTACGMQPLLGVRVELTPSIFGYSMLYPYSDNYLDDEEATAEEKLLFSRRFRCLLEGGDLDTLSARETRLADLIRLIEEQYPRAYHPQVFDALLAIHKAQEGSIPQANRQTVCTGAELLRVSCRKGGTSVLADACLAGGQLNEEESRFAFEWGVLLQLGDDLQDVHEDIRRGSDTLFSCAARSGTPMDGLAIQLLGFSESVGLRMDALPRGTTELKQLLKMSWRSLIIRAVADSHQFFSSAFLHEAERRSPFRFSFLRERQGRLTSIDGLYALLFHAFLSEPYEEKTRAASAGGVTRPSTPLEFV